MKSPGAAVGGVRQGSGADLGDDGTPTSPGSLWLFVAGRREACAFLTERGEDALPASPVGLLECLPTWLPHFSSSGWG